MLRLLRRLLYLLIVLYGLVFFVLATNTGTRLLLSAASSITDHQLKIASVDGTIATGLSINDLNFNDTHVKVKAAHTVLKIDLPSLLRMKLLVKQFTLHEADIAIANQPSAPKSKSVEIPSWLQFIDIEHIDINNVYISINDAKYHLNKAIINKTSNNAYQIDLDSNVGELNGIFSYNIYPIPSWDISAEAKNLTIPGLWKDSSSINFTVKTKGEWGLMKHAAIMVEKLNGKINALAVTGSTNANYEHGELKIDNLHFQFGNTHLDANGTIGSKVNFNWNMNVPELSAFIPVLKGSIVSQGRMDGTLTKPVINAHLISKNLELPDTSVKSLDITIQTLDANIKNMAMTINAKSIKYFDIGLTTVQLDTKAKFSGDDLLATLTGHIDQTTKINGTFDLPGLKTFAATINLDTANLATLPISIPQVNHIGGQLHAVFTLTGPLANPNWTLRGNVTNGTFKIPVLGTNVEQLSSLITWSDDKPLELGGTLKAGDGNADFNGNLVLSENDHVFTLSLSGKQLRLFNTHEYNVVVSPDLIFSINKAGAELSGDVTIPDADIHPVDFTQVATIPDETTFVHEKKAESTFYKNLVMDIKTQLGNNIRINYNSLKTNLDGKLRLMKASGAIPTAVGELYTKDGFYKAYGSNLEITSGRLSYTGSVLANPGIDVRAVKAIKRLVSNDTSGAAGDSELTVGIQVQGTLTKPVTTFFSSQSGLSQNDILSYLLFGRPSKQVTGFDGLALLKSIGPTSTTADNLTNDFQKSLGLNDFGLSSTDYYDTNTSTTSSATTVNVGKSLTDNLSVHYSVGILSPVSVLNFVYKINRHLKLQAEASSIENGADLVYSIERD